MRCTSWSLAVPLVLASLVASPPAHATPGFPDTIASHLALDFRPPCSVCHATASGGGPLAKPFGLALQQRGLQPFDSASLRAALDRLEDDGVDSDGNGIPDITQLRAGQDPNTGQQLDGPEPSYGCFHTVASRGHLPTLGVAGYVAFLLVGLGFCRRKRASV